MKKFLVYLLTLVIVIFGVTFTFKNNQSVEINYYFDFQQTLQLPVLLMITLIIGVLLGMLTNMMIVLKLKTQLRVAKKEIKQNTQELTNLRTIPIKNSI